MNLKVRPKVLIFFIMFIGMSILFTALGIPWYAAVVLTAVGLTFEWLRQFLCL